MHIRMILNSEGHEFPATGAGLQAAIDDLPATGGKVWLPSGNILVATTINITQSNVSIQGCGDGEEGEGATRVYATAAIRMFNVTSPRNVLFRDFLIEGSASDNGQYAIYLDGVHRARIDSMTFYHYHYGIWSTGETWTPKILFCHFLECGYGIYLHATDPQIIGNDFKLNDIAGMYFNGFYDAFICDNEIVGEEGKTTSAGIEIVNKSRGRIVGNSIRDCAGDGIKISGTSDHITIVGNTIRNNGENGIDIHGTTDRTIIMGNEIEDQTGVAVLINVGVTLTQILFNVMDNNAGGTITDNGTNTRIHGNEGNVGLYQSAAVFADPTGTAAAGTTCIFEETTGGTVRIYIYDSAGWHFINQDG